MNNTSGGGGDVGQVNVTLSKNTNAISSPLSEDGLLHAPAAHPGDPGPSTSSIGNTVNGPIPQGNIPTEFFSHMMQMMKQMTDRLATQREDKVKINDIFLSSYDPDANVGIREWCQHVTKAIETYNLNDYDIRMKVGSLLKGRAKLWVDNWMVTTSSWDELKDKLIMTFEPESRYSRDIVKFREHIYNPTKDIAEFLTRAWVLWKRVTKDKLNNDDAVEAVIGCIDDERLRIELLSAKASSVPELISVASSIQLAINCTPHRVTGVAPLTLLTRRQHCVPPELMNLVNMEKQSIDVDVLQQLVQQRMTFAAQQDEQRFDRTKARIRHFQRGDYVLIKNNPRNQTCLDLKFSEPYEVLRVLDSDRYLVKKVVGRGRPRKVAHDQLRRAPQPGEQAGVSAGAEDDSATTESSGAALHPVTPQPGCSRNQAEPQPSTSRDAV